MSATVIPASQAHFRVLDYMGGDSTITEFPVTFCLLFLQSSCPCDVFESSRCSKMNANSQVLCITDFDTFKKLSILSKILRVYSHLPKRREFSKRKFASPRGHGISLFFFCSYEIFDCSSILLLHVTWKNVDRVLQCLSEKLKQRKRIIWLSNQTVSVWYWL